MQAVGYAQAYSAPCAHAQRRYTRAVSERELLLERLLGHALRAMAKTNADPEYLAAFVDEYRPIFARELGIHTATSSHSDLKAVVKEALGEVLSVRQVRRRVAVQIGTLRTTVSIDPARLARLEQRLGASAAREQLQSFAAEVPNTLDRGQRSGWFDRQIDAFLTLSAQDSESHQARH
jgi:hypothetical protein